MIDFSRRKRRSQDNVGPLPATTARSGEFQLIDLPAGMEGIATPPTATLPGQFAVPLTSDAASLAQRAYQYGRTVVMRDMPVDIEERLNKAEVDPIWHDAGKFIKATSHMAENGVTEIFNLPAPDLKQFKLSKSVAATLWMRGHLFGNSDWSQLKATCATRFTAEEIRLLTSATEALARDQSAAHYLATLQLLNEVFPTVKPGSQQQQNEGDEEQDNPVPTELLNNLNDYIQLVGSDSPTWAPIFNHGLPLINKVRPTKKLERRRIPGYFGGFRFPHRALLPSGDGMCFAYRTHTVGGTILMDVSGSMELDHDDLQTLIDICPTIQLACYSEERGSHKTRGRLVTAIKDGRAVDVTHLRESFGECNVCDGPALEWLIRQREPRIWISDGYVNGLGSVNGMNLIAESLALVRKGHIQRFENIKEFVGKYKLQKETTQ